MSEGKVIEAVKSGDTGAIKRLLAGGADLNERDEQGWAPLHWAAGRGDAEAVGILLELGADIAATGRDRRTPLMVAKAAEWHEAASILAQAEKEKGIWSDPREKKPYCRAYYLRDMRRFRDWPAGAPGSPLSDDAIVYLHQDFTVTRSIWREESVIFDRVTPEWREFCSTELEFHIPEQLLE